MVGRLYVRWRWTSKASEAAAEADDSLNRGQREDSRQPVATVVQRPGGGEDLTRPTSGGMGGRSANCTKGESRTVSSPQNQLKPWEPVFGLIAVDTKTESRCNRVNLNANRRARTSASYPKEST